MGGNGDQFDLDGGNGEAQCSVAETLRRHEGDDSGSCISITSVENQSKKTRIE